MESWNIYTYIYTCLNLVEGRGEGGFIQVVKVRMLHGFTSRDPFRGVVGQHFLSTRKQKNLAQTPCFGRIIFHFQQAQSRNSGAQEMRMDRQPTGPQTSTSWTVPPNIRLLSSHTHRQQVQAILVQVLHRQVSTLPLRKGAFVVRQAFNIRPHVVVWRSQSPGDTGDRRFHINAFTTSESLKLASLPAKHKVGEDKHS